MSEFFECFEDNFFWNDQEKEDQKKYYEFDPGTPTTFPSFDFDNQQEQNPELEHKKQEEDFDGFTYYEKEETKTKIIKAPLRNINFLDSSVIQKRVKKIEKLDKRHTQKKTKTETQFLLQGNKGKDYIDLNTVETLYKKPFSYYISIEGGELGKKAKVKRVTMRLVYKNEDEKLLNRNFIEIGKKYGTKDGVKIRFKFTECSFRHKRKDFKLIVFINGKQVYKSRSFELLARKKKVCSLPRGIINLKNEDRIGDYSIKKQKKINRNTPTPVLVMNGMVPLGIVSYLPL